MKSMTITKCMFAIDDIIGKLKYDTGSTKAQKINASSELLELIHQINVSIVKDPFYRQLIPYFNLKSNQIRQLV